MSKAINPLIPMGAITGNLSKSQICEMLDCYKAAGIEQFLIYPRDGCEVEYMSERWLDICEDIVSYASILGMKIWLYDEFNWPSGTCFGKVLEKSPDFSAHHIEIENDRCVIKRTIRHPDSIPDSYSDILNPDAVDCFIKLTHEKYFSRLGKYFGETIVGIFTDEPSFGYFVMNDNEIPYFKDAEKLYFDAFHRDLFEDVKSNSSDFRRDYQTLLGQRFAEVFCSRLSSWCKQHKILLTGHLMGDDNPYSWSRFSGNAIAALRSFGLPGIDEINTRTDMNSVEWTLFGLAQAASRVCGGGLAELFALGPTDIPPSRIEQMIWLCAAFGIDHYVLAVAAADAKGNVKKNGWYNPMNYSNPWFCGYKALGESAKEAATLAKKELLVDVCIKIPVTAISENKNCSGQRLNDNITSLARRLSREQIQWIITDENEENAFDAPTLDVTKDSVDALVEKARAVRKSNIFVYSSNKLAENVLVRCYSDDTALILDLDDSENAKELVIKCNGEAFPIKLFGRGHFIFSGEKCQRYQTISQASPIFEISLDRHNSLRANLTSECNEFVFYVQEQLDGITLASRQYLPGGQLTLDGNIIEFDDKVTTFTKGISELYLSSKPFSLKEGTHKIAITQTAKSEPYLPSCFVCGGFACEGDSLRKMPDRVGLKRLDKDTLPQFAGCISFKAAIEIPSDCTHIAIDSCNNYTELYVDGVFLGGQLASHIWEKPQKSKTALIEIKQYTTIGPIFGRANDATTSTDGANWTRIVDFFPGKYQKCGIVGISFLKPME